MGAMRWFVIFRPCGSVGLPFLGACPHIILALLVVLDIGPDPLCWWILSFGIGLVVVRDDVLHPR
jgi:hypothetical protein